MKPTDQGARLKLMVKGQDGNVIFFIINSSTQLKRLMSAYCDHHSVYLNSIAFLFDGHCLQPEQCPDELHMEDGDEIDAIFSVQSARINLKVKVKGQDGYEASFRIHRSTRLKKLMDVYCYRYCLDINRVTFLFNGRLLQAEHTPDELKMEDGDEIDVVFCDHSARIRLKVKCQDGNENFFSINRSTQLKTLMNAYCDHHSVDINSIAFLFDGRRLQAEQSPNEVQMKDGDEIDAIFYDQSARINLKVRGQDGFEASFSIRRSTRLKKLMNVYCYQCCLDFNGVAFLFNGRLLQAEHTPDELGMEDGDEMLAMLQLRCV